MNFAQFSINQKVLVNLITIIAIVIGAYIAFHMQREVFPRVRVDYAYVQTIYPGASATEVEELVTVPIEDALKNVDGIDTYSSGSIENTSFIFIELDPDVDNKDKVINDIAREVDKVDLPDDVEDPETRELTIEDPLIEISFTGDNVPEDDLRTYAKNFEEILKNIKGIGTIEKVGWRDKEIWIEVDPENLSDYYISLSQVIRSIQSQHINLPGGKLETGSKELMIRTIGEIEDPKGFGDIIVRTNTDGNYLRVKDVAKIQETFEEQMRVYKTNGRVSINLIPKKKTKADSITMVDIIKEEVENYKQILPPAVSINLLNDTAFYVKRRLNVLISNGSMGLVLLLLTLLLFLNVRVALVTALGIPFAFMTALIMMSFFNVSLNLITMFGLIIVLGMIVDDAIVIAENSYRYMEEGMPVKEAVIRGTTEVVAPVTATIMTTIAAFLPLMFISGIMGKFLKFFPMGIILCLLASLFEAVVILPSHLAEWVKPLKSKEDLGIKEDDSCGTGQDNNCSFFMKIIRLPWIIILALVHYFTSHERKGSESLWYQKLLASYTRLLKFSVHNRYKMAGMMVVILIGTIIFSIKVIPFKLFPEMIEIFYVRVEKPEGTSLAETGKTIEEVEKVILNLSKDELDNVTATVGFSGDLGGGPFDKHGTKYGQCVIYLTPESKRDRNADAIIADLREKILALNLPKIVNLEFEKVQNGPPVGKPVSIDIKGDEFETLLKISDEVKAYMSTIDGIKDIKDDYELGKEEIRIFINKKESARLGLSVFQIASTVRYAFEGGVAATFRKGEEDIDVIVKLPEDKTDKIETLENLTIPNDQNRLIKLNQVAYFKREQGVSGINHKDGRRLINVTATLDENKIKSVEANRSIINKFKDLSERYPGYTFKAGGEWEDTTESMQSLAKAFIIAFMLIYLILATQFKSFIQPLIILTSVPFGLIGVVFALYLHGQPISLMALFGTVGLTGVVVNDALILVDFINRRREEGMHFVDAAIDAGRVRLRPILLTSITTIIALVPLVYGLGGEEPFVVPSAIAMAYGLLAATFLTLVIVPSIYAITEDIKNLTRKKGEKEILNGNNNNKV
ncbi:MAG: efflux RND transporter permease subunit [Elusimicrobiota bacterium]